MLSKLQPAGAFVTRQLLTPDSSVTSKLSSCPHLKSTARRAFLAISRDSKKLRSNVSSAATSRNGPPDDNKCFITTPIYYVNDQPHIGHVYTSTVADAYARFQRSRGRDVFFLTGTDEHGLKVEQSAIKRGISPQALADENSACFREMLVNMDISFDGFIRTTEPYHKLQVQHLVEKLRQKGDVYLGKFEGWYDEGQEEYYTETKAKELSYKSPISGKDMSRSSEENYYFKLSAYQTQLEKLHRECPDFLSPPARRNEILSRITQGLNDVPISRTNFSWGIGMPNDDAHVIYVWIDALLNYITALGLAEEPNSAASVDKATRHSRGELMDYWPASVHIMAKEISWFHSVIWPALLMALELPLPERVHAHGFWIRDGKKMSKSLGNFVDIKTLTRYTDHYGLDGFRYFMLVEGPIMSQDANFASSRVQEVYNTDLVNTVGNSLSRTTAMVNKYYDGFVPTERGPQGGRIAFGERYDWPVVTAEAANQVIHAIEALEFPKAAAAAVALVAKVDLFINELEPFRLARDVTKAEELGAILYQCLEALRIACVLLEPFLPNKISEVSENLDLGHGTLDERVKWGLLQPGSTVKKMAIFPRVHPLDELGMPVVT